PHAADHLDLHSFPTRRSSDLNSDGTVDMGDMSAESTKANDENVVFRFQDSYFSTKKADVKKDLIVVEPRQAKDYKRVEIYMNKEDRKSTRLNSSHVKISYAVF